VNDVGPTITGITAQTGSSTTTVTAVGTYFTAGAFARIVAKQDMRLRELLIGAMAAGANRR
jgi:hypothetical protein